MSREERERERTGERSQCTDRPSIEEIEHVCEREEGESPDLDCGGCSPAGSVHPSDRSVTDVESFVAFTGAMGSAGCEQK